MLPAQESSRAVQRIVSARWTPDLVSGGWTPVSDYFLDSYTKLTPPLSTSEAMLVIHLMRHKWDAAPPFPGFKTLARRMGVTATSVRNHARALEHKGYLRRVKRIGTTNYFELTQLFVALEKLQAYEAGQRDGQQGKRPQETKAAAVVDKESPF
jgi:Helix-turn-helix domain